MGTKRLQGARSATGTERSASEPRERRRRQREAASAMAEQYQQWNMGYPSPFPQYHFNAGMYLPPDQNGLYRPPQFPTPTGQLLPGPPLGAPPNLGPHAQAPADDQGKKGKGAAKKGAGKAKKSPKKKPKKPKKKTPTKAELQKKEQAKKKKQQDAEKKRREREQEQLRRKREREAKAKQKKTMKSQQTKTGKKKKEKDPNAPKRARTAFNFFLDDFREKYKKDHPEAKGVVEVTKAGSQRWKEMSPEEKQPFEEMATRAREAYTKAKEEYEEQGG